MKKHSNIKIIKAEAITNTVTRIIKQSGYDFDEIKSNTTTSIYYKIYSGDQSLIFRVADHNSSKNILTFRTDKGNCNDLERFVKNRIHDLSYRNTKALLGLRK